MRIFGRAMLSCPDDVEQRQARYSKAVALCLLFDHFIQQRLTALVKLKFSDICQKDFLWLSGR
jgi:hypothetical protein